LLYGQPLFWWLRAQLRMAAELLADDLAARQAGKLAYVEQLIALAKSSRAGLMPLAGAVALYSSSSQFYRRMHMLISRSDPFVAVPSTRWRLTSLVATALVVMLAAGMAGVRPASGQQPAPGGDAGVAPAPSGTASSGALPLGAEIPVQAGKAVESNLPLTKLPIVGRLFAVADGVAGEDQLKSEADVLRAKLAATEQQVRALEEQLNALKADVKAAAGTGLNQAVPRQANTVTLTRVNEDGSISHESWSTSEDGRPEKLIWKKLTRSDDSPIAAAKPALVNDGRVVKEYEAKDGTVVRHVYDAETGRLIETRRGERSTVPALAQAGNVPADPNAAVRRGIVVTERAPEKPRGGAGGLDSTSASGLDLVSLATAYADTVGEVEAAKSRLGIEETASANKTGSAHELESARLALRSAQRKFELLRNIASVANDAAKADLERAQQLVRAGAASSELAAAAESRWKMLNAILQSGLTDQVQKQ
jgi:hypothetical protein